MKVFVMKGMQFPDFTIDLIIILNQWIVQCFVEEVTGTIEILLVFYTRQSLSVF